MHASHHGKLEQPQCLALAPIIGVRHFYVEHLPWSYRVEFHQEEQNVEVEFQPMSTARTMALL